MKFYRTDRVTLKHYTISRCFLNILREHTTKSQASGKVINGSKGVTKGHVVLSRYANMEDHLQALTMGYSCRLSMLDTDVSSQFTLRAETTLWMVRQVKEVIPKVKLTTFAGREISQKQTKILVMPNRCKFRGDAFIV